MVNENAANDKYVGGKLRATLDQAIESAVAVGGSINLPMYDWSNIVQDAAMAAEYLTTDIGRERRDDA